MTTEGIKRDWLIVSKSTLGEAMGFSVGDFVTYTTSFYGIREHCKIVRFTRKMVYIQVPGFKIPWRTNPNTLTKEE